MALPGHRRNRSHRKERAIHQRLKQKTLAACPSCNAARLPHHACPTCGFYAGTKKGNQNPAHA